MYDSEDYHDENDEIPIFSFQRKICTNRILFPDIDFLITNFYSSAFYANDDLPFVEKSCSAIFVGSTTGGRITKNVVENLSLPRLKSDFYFKNNENVKFLLPKLVQYDDDNTKKLLETMGFGKKNYI